MKTLRVFRSAVVALVFALVVALPASSQITELVSINAAGTATGNDVSTGQSSSPPLLSPNGRFVVFASQATNLVGLPDTNLGPDLFLRDRLTGITILITINAAGTAAGDGPSSIGAEVAMTPDARFVTFESEASDLVAQTIPSPFIGQVYVRDTCIGAPGPCTPATTLVSINTAGTMGSNGSSFEPSISSDGRFVAFVSSSTDLVGGGIDANGQVDVFVRDLVASTTALVSINSAGTAAANFGAGTPAIISPDGSRVAFISSSTDLVAVSDTNPGQDIFVRNLMAGSTVLASINAAGTATGNEASFGPLGFSDNGNRLVFTSFATDLVALPDANGIDDSFVRDLMAGTTSLVSINSTGTAACNAASQFPVISGDGNFVAFQSAATNLTTDVVPGMGFGHIYRRGLLSGTTILVSADIDGTATSGSSSPAISADGNRVVFDSGSTNMVVTPDNNNVIDIFVRDIAAATTALVTITGAGTASANFGGEVPSISADGSTVGMISSSNELVTTPDANHPGQDVFVFQPSPAINAGGAVNAASFAAGAAVAPGSIGAVFGSRMVIFLAFAGAVPLPTTLGGATMQFNASQSVPKFFVSPLQVNMQFPWELAGQMSASLTNTVFGAASDPEVVNLATFAPGLFATNQAGSGQGAILIANTPFLAAPDGAFPGSRPAVRGVDFLEVYWTGGGPVDPPVATGTAASASPLSATTTLPTITIGGVNTPVLFSGLAPGFVGLYVATCQVQMGTPTGAAIPVVLTIDGQMSNTVTIAVE